MAAVQFGLRVTSRTSLQIPPQPVLPSSQKIPQDTDQPFLAQPIINPKRGMEGPFQTPKPPKTCSSPGPAGKSCCNFDVLVPVLVLTLAGVVILLLLYRLLQMRHRCVGQRLP